MKFRTFGDQNVLRQRKSCAVTLGNFDGVHLGHRLLIQQILKHQMDGLSAVVVTFFPHPVSLLAPDQYQNEYLTTVEERAAILLSLGVDAVLVFEFTAAFAALDPTEFCEEVLLRHLDIAHLELGYDFRFGKGRLGDAAFLRHYSSQTGWTVNQVDPVTYEGVPVSSSRIRRLLREGDLASGNFCLGRSHYVKGQVIHGDKIGRTIGFPTANISALDRVIPGNGVYFGYLQLTSESHFLKPCLISIGIRETLALENPQRRLEVHVLNFSGELYGEHIVLYFAKRIRDEQKFQGLQALRAQIEDDVLAVTPAPSASDFGIPLNFSLVTTDKD